jgi:hypothetical protein
VSLIVGACGEARLMPFGGVSVHDLF